MSSYDHYKETLEHALVNFQFSEWQFENSIGNWAAPVLGPREVAWLLIPDEAGPREVSTVLLGPDLRVPDDDVDGPNEVSTVFGLDLPPSSITCKTLVSRFEILCLSAALIPVEYEEWSPLLLAMLSNLGAQVQHEHMITNCHLTFPPKIQSTQCINIPNSDSAFLPCLSALCSGLDFDMMV